MTQPLTQQQIADAKQAATEAMESNKFDAEWHSSFILQLIATLEARDAAFDEMFETLKLVNELIISRMINRKLVMDEHLRTVDGVIQNAIAHAEKVK